MDTSDKIASAAAALAFLTFTVTVFWRVRDKREARHASLMMALRGDKAAIGYEAHRLAEDGWPSRSKQRRELPDALCLAFVFERSDRARALVYEALESAPVTDAPAIVAVLRKLVLVFSAAEGHGADFDLERGWKRLATLGRLFKVPDVTSEAERRATAIAELKSRKDGR
jgi:hypothetical protein